MKFWISWENNFKAHGGFELRAPWWVYSVEKDGTKTIVAAIKANDENAAKLTITRSYFRSVDSEYAAELCRSIKFVFVETKPDNWSPFTQRFKRSRWMKWDDEPNNETNNDVETNDET